MNAFLRVKVSNLHEKCISIIEVLHDKMNWCKKYEHNDSNQRVGFKCFLWWIELVSFYFDFPESEKLFFSFHRILSDMKV